MPSRRRTCRGPRSGTQDPRCCTGQTHPSRSGTGPSTTGRQTLRSGRGQSPGSIRVLTWCSGPRAPTDRPPEPVRALLADVVPACLEVTVPHLAEVGLILADIADMGYEGLVHRFFLP